MKIFQEVEQDESVIGRIVAAQREEGELEIGGLDEPAQDVPATVEWESRQHVG